MPSRLSRGGLVNLAVQPPYASPPAQVGVTHRHLHRRVPHKISDAFRGTPLVTRCAKACRKTYQLLRSTGPAFLLARASGFLLAGSVRGLPSSSFPASLHFYTGKLVGVLGFEPRFRASKALVLPLDDTPLEGSDDSTTARMAGCSHRFGIRLRDDAERAPSRAHARAVPGARVPVLVGRRVLLGQLRGAERRAGSVPLRRYHFTSAAPQVKPAPKAANASQSPRARRPSPSAS